MIAKLLNWVVKCVASPMAMPHTDMYAGVLPVQGICNLSEMRVENHSAPPLRILHYSPLLQHQQPPVKIIVDVDG